MIPSDSNDNVQKQTETRSCNIMVLGYSATALLFSPAYKTISIARKQNSSKNRWFCNANSIFDAAIKDAWERKTAHPIPFWIFSPVSENCDGYIHIVARLAFISHSVAGEAGITRIMSALGIHELYDARRIM
jgi:hypothetical protein